MFSSKLARVLWQSSVLSAEESATDYDSGDHDSEETNTVAGKDSPAEQHQEAERSSNCFID